MSDGRAVGSRLGYAAMPGSVHDWVERTLGSQVVAAVDQVGGFSPGCATRLTCADGSRAFVKAVGAELNPDSPVLFRREVQALELLGSHPLWADLLASHDAGADGGDWVALLLEDVEGTHPDLADDATMDRLLAATDELVVVMNERVPAPPRPAAAADAETGGVSEGGAMFRPGPVDLTRVFAGWLASLDHVPDLPADLVPDWLRAHVGELRPGVAAMAASTTDHVVHYDIRDDNLLQRPGGEIVFLDWGAFGIGPAWLDPLLARLERVHLPWFDESLSASPALARAGDDLVTSWLVGVGTHLAWRAHTATTVNLPTIQGFRRRESARFLGAAQRRLGLA